MIDPEPILSIDSISYREITDLEDLARSCERWRTAPAIAIDTEFARERTFYPALGLIQVSDGRENVLIDPLSIDDLTPLSDLLVAPEITKVLHSCGEDLEVLHHHLGIVPTPLVDTQVAASMAGIDHSMGYARLVEHFCGVELPKAHTRSNWLRRPLTDAQKRYAALDVAYLLECNEALLDRLVELDRMSWLQDDCERLSSPERFRIDDQATFRKLARGRRLRKHQLVVLHELCMWRERQARERDLPRNFVLRENALAVLAQRRPTTPSELKQIKELDRRELERHGKTLLRLIAAARGRPPAEQPEPLPLPIDLRPYKEVIQALRGSARDIADALAVPVELLASKRQVEALLRRYLSARDPVLPKDLRGWRAEVVGNPLWTQLKRKIPDPGF